MALRYVGVAGACLVMHNLIVIGASMRGASMLQAAGLSFCIMVVVGYILLAAFVFPVGYTWLGFARYVAAMAGNFPLSTGLLWLFLEGAGQPMVIAAPASTFAMVLINFVLSRWAITERVHSASGDQSAQCAS